MKSVFVVYVSDTSVLRLFTDCCNELCLFEASDFVSYVWDTLVLNELRFCSTDEDFERAELAVEFALFASFCASAIAVTSVQVKFVTNQCLDGRVLYAGLMTLCTLSFGNL